MRVSLPVEFEVMTELRAGLTDFALCREMWIDWAHPNSAGWFILHSINLADPHFDGLGGVYVIWCSGLRAATVRVGQGVVRSRLSSHRTNPMIQRYDHIYGPLYVSWAEVPKHCRNGVERYLGLMLKPAVGRLFPAVDPIKVNLPWQSATNRQAV